MDYIDVHRDRPGGIFQVTVMTLVMLLVVGAVVSLYSNSYQAVERNDTRLELLTRIGQDRRKLLPLFHSARSVEVVSAQRLRLYCSRDWLELGEDLPVELRFKEDQLWLQGGKKSLPWSNYVKKAEFRRLSSDVIELRLVYLLGETEHAHRFVVPRVMNERY